MRATVIGAGVVGLATALELCERGARVTVVERNAALGGNASWLAGGMLAPFCEGEHAPAAVVERGAEAIAWWARRVPTVARTGTLVVAPPRDVSEIDRFAARTHGWERVDEARIAELEPDLAGRFRNGLFYREEGSVDPRAAMAALLDKLSEGGAEVRFGTEYPPAPVAEVVDLGSRAAAAAEVVDLGSRAAAAEVSDLGYKGVVVDCRGFSARAELPELRGVRGEMLLLRTREISLRRPVRLLHPRFPLYVVPRDKGVFMIGATMIETADASRVSARSAIELLGAAYALHPAFGEAEIVEMGAGVRPAYPDNAPRIEQRNGRIYVNGFYRHGFLLAPYFAQRAAEMAVGCGLKTSLV